MKKKITVNLVLKGLNVLISFLTIPLIIDYLKPGDYGLLITFGSFLGIGSVFDFGLGDNLRLGIAKSNVSKNTEDIKTLINVTYSRLIIIGGAIFTFFTLIEFLFGWSKTLNVGVERFQEIREFVILSTIFYSLKFVLNLIHRIFLGFKKANYSTAINLIISLFTYIILLFLLRNNTSSLFSYVLTIGLLEIVILVLSTIYFLRKFHYTLNISFKNITLNNNPLFNSYFPFFIISLSAFLVIATDNFLISHFFSVEDVATYHVCFKLFNISAIIFTTLTLPIFVLYAEKYLLKDFEWLKKTNKKLVKVWYFLVLMILLILIFSQQIISIWFNGNLTVPIELCFTMAIYFILRAYNSIHNLFLSGIGKLKLLSINAAFSMIINIPFSVFFSIYLDMGLKGIMLGTIISTLPLVIINKVQYNRLINKIPEHSHSTNNSN
ncbi:hypothetical protein OAT18_02250 [Tenacibaculum sp.]|nr:hypothetical protein [Tenacibaculum sp.]